MYLLTPPSELDRGRTVGGGCVMFCILYLIITLWGQHGQIRRKSQEDLAHTHTHTHTKIKEKKRKKLQPCVYLEYYVQL